MRATDLGKEESVQWTTYLKNIYKKSSSSGSPILYIIVWPFPRGELTSIVNLSQFANRFPGTPYLVEALNGDR